MKKNKSVFMIILVLALMLLVSACKKEEENKLPEDNIGQVEGGTEANGKTTEDSMKDFDELVANNQMEDIISFIDNNIKSFSSIEADKMVLELERLLDDNLMEEEDVIFDYEAEDLMELADISLFFPEDKIKEIKNKEFQSVIERLYNLKYRLINLEGNYYLIIDYVKFKEYDSYTSDEIKEYINIMADATENPIAIDGGLYISYDQLADRLIRVENYLSKYSNGKKHPDVLNLYGWWLETYLTGLPNSPIGDYQTGMINEEIFASYKKLATTKDSATAFIVSKYIGVIDENKGKIDEKVLKMGNQLVEEALDLVDISK